MTAATSRSFPRHTHDQCETALVRLAARVVVNSTVPSIRERAPFPSVRRARLRIDADPSARSTLADLASEAGLSRYQGQRNAEGG